MTSDALAEFASALCTGDSARIADLDADARARLQRFCRGYLGDVDAAEDAVQQVLARAATSKSRPSSPRAWILTIARNHCLDLLRARGARPDAERLATNFDAARETAGPITRLVGAERESDLARALESLSTDERELLRLRYAEDLSRVEVAQLLGATEDVVKSRLYESLEKLRRILRERTRDGVI